MPLGYLIQSYLPGGWPTFFTFGNSIKLFVKVVQTRKIEIN